MHVESIEGTRTRLTRQESREATRHRLIAAAIELFAHDGVSATSLHAVAEQAGYSRGAFHSNFADKVDLSSAVAAAVIAEVSPALEKALAADASSNRRLSDYIRVHLTFCVENPLKARALIEVVGYLDRAAIHSYEDRAEQSLDGLIELFTDGQKRNEMRVFDTSLMAFMLRTTLDATAGRLGTGSFEVSASHVIEQLVASFDLATRAFEPATQRSAG